MEIQLIKPTNVDDVRNHIFIYVASHGNDCIDKLPLKEQSFDYVQLVFDEGRLFLDSTLANTKKITGYRELTLLEIASINEVKAAANHVGLLVDFLESDSKLDQYWISIAKTELQQGFMALTRAIAQPTTF